MRTITPINPVLLTALTLSLSATAQPAPSPAITPVPSPAVERAATVEVRVAPDHPDWTYRLGERVVFNIAVTADRIPLENVPITYRIGRDGMPATAQTAVTRSGGISLDAGTLDQPGFLRCVVTAEVAGRTVRGLATAGFEPERITPTQIDPPDFDAFWDAGKKQLAAVPMEPRLTLLPDSCTDTVNVYHLSLRTVGGSWTGPARVYGIYCEPRKPGRYPAVLRVPGAGVRPYFGDRELAARGAITLEIGIHGIPVNERQEIYDRLLAGALDGYWTFNLDDRDRFYYRRVFLSCLRANDFLTSREMWDGKGLVVAGASQGGALSIATAALDPRVTGLVAIHPALSDLSGDLHGRTGGWPRPFQKDSNGSAFHATPAKIATAACYDTVNFARRLRVPGFFTWGYNDEVCEPTSMYSAFNVISAPRQLTLQLEVGHAYPPIQHEIVNRWIATHLGLP